MSNIHRHLINAPMEHHRTLLMLSRSIPHLDQFFFLVFICRYVCGAEYRDDHSPQSSLEFTLIFSLAATQDKFKTVMMWHLELQMKHETHHHMKEIDWVECNIPSAC